MQVKKSDLKKVVREVLNEAPKAIRLDEARKNVKTKKDAHKQLLEAFTTVMAVKRWVDSQGSDSRRISKKLDVIATSLTDSVDAIDEELE